jgi:hypothetical protein
MSLGFFTAKISAPNLVPTNQNIKEMDLRRKEIRNQDCKGANFIESYQENLIAGGGKKRARDTLST